MVLFLGFLLCEIVGIAIGVYYSDDIKEFIHRNFD
jgi:hypothetical protein